MLIRRHREPVFGLFEEAEPITEQEWVRQLHAEGHPLFDCPGCAPLAYATMRDGRPLERCEAHRPAVRWQAPVEQLALEEVVHGA